MCLIGNEGPLIPFKFIHFCSEIKAKSQVFIFLWFKDQTRGNNEGLFYLCYEYLRRINVEICILVAHICDLLFCGVENQ